MLSTQKGLPLKIITNNIYLKSSFKTSKALIFLFYFSQWHLEVFNIKTKILCTNSSALGRAAILFIQQIPRPRYVCTWHKRQWSAAFVLYIHTCIKSTRLACRRPLFPLFPLVSCSPTPSLKHFLLQSSRRARRGVRATPAAVTSASRARMRTAVGGVGWRVLAREPQGWAAGLG